MPFIAGVHIVITFNHTVVKLALFVCALAEIMLKFRLGGNDELFPIIGKFQVATQGGIQPLGALLLQHPLTVGRVAYDDTAFCRQAHFGSIAILEGDAVGNTGFSGICH